MENREQTLKIVIAILLISAIALPGKIAFIHIAIQCLVPFIIFYIDYKLNKNKLSVAGFIFLGIYYFYYVFNALTIIDFEATKSVEASLKYIVNILEYSALTMMLLKNEDEVVVKTGKIGILVSIFLNQGLEIAKVWFTDSYNTVLRDLCNMTGSIFILFVCYVLYSQYIKEIEKPIVEEDIIEAKVVKENQKLKSVFGGKKFRNPALEEQEKRLAAEREARKKEKEEEK